MSKHTPGPWRVGISENRKDGTTIVQIEPVDRSQLAVGYSWSVSPETALHYARLMAAAPDLLASCKEVAVMLDELCEVFGKRPGGTGFNRMMAAINKAEGSAE